MAAWWLAIVSAVSILSLYVPVSGNKEHELIEDLTNKTMKYARPLNNSIMIMRVNMIFTTISIDIDEKDHILTVVGNLFTSWKDDMLVWDPILYDGIKGINLDINDIWTPDIHLRHGAGDLDMDYAISPVYVYFRGFVYITRPIKSAKVSCFFDSLYFPFDTAYGSMEYETWLYLGDKINLTYDGNELDVQDMYLKRYEPHQTWDLIDGKVRVKTEIKPCCTEPHNIISYEFKFHRNSGQYKHTLLIPSFLLSILTVLLFLLPKHNSDRITLGVVLFCCFFVLLVYTGSLVPDWHRIPYFVRFLMFNLFVITLFTFLNSIIVKLSNSEDGQEVPKIVRTIMFEYVARIFCMKSMVQRSRWRQLVTSQYQYQSLQKYSFRVSVTSDSELLQPIIKGDSLEDFPPGVEMETDGKRSLEEDVAFIRTFIASSFKKMKDGERDKKLLSEWKDLAAVVNRMFFILYLTIVLIAIGVVCIQINMKVGKAKAEG